MKIPTARVRRRTQSRTVAGVRWRRIPQLAATAILAGCLVVQAPLLAEAGTRDDGGFKTHVVALKTSSCSSGTVVLNLQASAVVDSDFFGNGTYYLRSEIRWQRQSGGGWVTTDHRVAYSAKRYLANGGQAPVSTSVADDTTWGKSTFTKGTWRARVILTVLEVSGGPDEVVDSSVVKFPAEKWTTQC